MAYTLKQMIAPKNAYGARSGIKMTKVIGVTIHMTDNWSAGAGAISHGNYLKGSGSKVQASWHYAVDDKYAVQSIPEDEVAWHAGDAQGNGNYKTIAIEICVNPESNLKKACDNAVALTVDILKRHKLSADKVYRHYDWSGKICPSMMMKNNEPYSWSSFKAKVKEAYNKKTEEANAAAKIVTKKEDLKVGVKVKFNGNSYCYASSDGTAGKGSKPKAGNYTVTHYAKGAKYPIHLGSYGWVSLSSCGITSSTPKTPAVGKTVYFDGKAYCYASSTGTGKGSKPKAGNYKITHYAKGAKYPIHIGSYGWVSDANCTVQ